MKYALNNPARLWHMKKDGLDILAICYGCHSDRIVSTEMLVERLGIGYPVPQIAEHLVCSKCGSKNVETRPNWKTVISNNLCT